MRNVLLIMILLVSSFGFCQQTKILNVDSLKLELAKFLVKKNQLKNLEEFTVKNRGVYLGGIHKDKLNKELKNGIYVFNNNSTHSFSFFVIIDDSSFNILDISTLQGLKESIEETLKFADKQNYCVEIIKTYISGLINVHYSINRNPRNRLDKNCEIEIKPIKSTFNLNSLKTKLAEFLVEKEEIRDIDTYFKYPDDLFVSKMDIYYGMDENKNMECGVYTFAYLDGEKQNSYYLILNEDWIEIFDILSPEGLDNGINKVLDLSENQKYCHLKTGQIIKSLIKIKYTNSCLDNPVFDLP